MNPPEQQNGSAAIRTEIDYTRRRMDQTIDALGERLKGRHLLDEALHFIRTQQENGNMTKLKNKFSETTDSALNSVVDTVKSNPVPLALIGAGVAWYIGTRIRGQSGNGNSDYTYEQFDRGEYGDPHLSSVGEGKPAQEAGEWAEEDIGSGERWEKGTGKLQERARERVRAVSEQAGKWSNRVRDRSQEFYRQGRDRVKSTVLDHPLESGLICLAVGFIGGLSLPASDRLRGAVAPGTRQLRNRGRDLIQRGQRVVESGVRAAADEAENQKLMPKSSHEENSPAGASRPTQAQPQNVPAP